MRSVFWLAMFAAVLAGCNGSLDWLGNGTGRSPQDDTAPADDDQNQDDATSDDATSDDATPDDATSDDATSNDATSSPPLVNLQITEEDDVGALADFMVEVNARQIKATLIVDETTAAAGCEQLRDYDAAGHEIMVYGRPDEPEGETVNLDMLSYEEQEEIISRAKDGIEECLGHPVEGFRSYHFAHNEDTWDVLDELDIRYNLSYVAHSTNAVAGHENDDWPYPVDGHEFWAVPMHSVTVNGSVKAFCDRPFSTLAAEDWEALMKSELDRMAAQGLPMKVEFHPWYSAHDTGRWDAYVGFLDYAVAQGAEFVTIEEMVDRIPTAE